MQITINTADILGDETTIRDEVIEQVSQALLTSMRTQAKAALTDIATNPANPRHAGYHRIPMDPETDAHINALYKKGVRFTIKQTIVQCLRYAYIKIVVHLYSLKGGVNTIGVK